MCDQSNAPNDFHACPSSNLILAYELLKNNLNSVVELPDKHVYIFQIPSDFFRECMKEILLSLNPALYFCVV